MINVQMRKGEWVVLTNITVVVGKSRWLIPQGFTTDFASIPKLFWSVWSPYDLRWAKAALLHDYLYDNRIGTRKEADLLFRQAMKESGAKWGTYQTFYYTVRTFGQKAWDT